MPSIKQEPSSWEYGPFVWEGEESIEMQFEEYPSTDFQAVAELEPSLGANGSYSVDAWVDPLFSPKLQIRNHDCMWSGRCGDLSHPNKGLCGGADPSEADSSNHNHSMCGGNKFSTVTAEAAASLNSKAAQKPILTSSNVLNISNNSAAKIPKVQAAQIPAGRSLLINPRNKQQTNRIPTVSTEDFLRERDGAVALHTRPDTPLSLDDDPPVFKHNKIDLATCTIGSNRLSLTGGSRYCSNYTRNYDDASSHRIINLLKEQLEDMENGNMRSCLSSCSDVGSLTDLLQDLKEINDDDGGGADDDSLGEDADSDSDSVSGGCDEEGISSSSSRNGCSKGGGISGGYTHAHHSHQDMSPLSSSSSSPSSSSSSSSSSASSSYEYQGTHVGDHSYTRPKNRYNLTDLGVQTPSDSEEEIDVVSIGEKNLPTNPTARDRRALQSHVAHKIARKTHSDGSQHHPRRRHSDDDYCSKTPSHHPGHHHRSSNNTGSDHHHHQQSHHHLSGSSSHNSPSKLGGHRSSSYAAFSPNYLTPASSTSISGTNTPLPGGSSSSSGSSNPRKRPSSKDERGSSGSCSSKNRHHAHARKKQRIPGKKPASDSCEEQETQEKRNLHNDMERQRRIGLKNLFEELKRQIPTLREKERAPKVNILREAAILCTRLNREQEQLKALHKQQERLLARVRQLRSSLHTQRRVMD